MSRFANQKQPVRTVKVSSQAKIQELLPPLIAELSLPVIRRNGLPLIYYLKFAGQRLFGHRTLYEQGIRDGHTLTLEAEEPEERSLIMRLRENRLGNVRWNCFLTQTPCSRADVQWDPSRVSVILPTTDEKADLVYEFAVKPALQSAGLSSSRIRIQAKGITCEDNEPDSISRPDSSTSTHGHPLCDLCQAAQIGLLSILDISGGDPLVFLSLGLLWGVGQTVILIHKHRAFVPLPGQGLPTITYQELPSEEFNGQLRLTIWQQTGMTVSEPDTCARCHGRFTGKDRMIVCVHCLARYHHHCRPAVCEKCGRNVWIWL